MSRLRVVSGLAVDSLARLIAFLITLMSGHPYADPLPLAVDHDFDGEAVRFLGAEGLVCLKASSLRPKGRLDVETLRRLGESDD